MLARAIEELEAALAGWLREWTSDGFLLFPSGERDQVVVRIRQELPLQRLRRRVDGYCAEAVRLGFRDVMVGPLERFSTWEGEPAGIVTIAMRSADGQANEITLALIAADSTCWLFEATAGIEARSASVRRTTRLLAELAFLGKGELRRRRYQYRPPAGWILLPHPRGAIWLHPEYPRFAARMIVFDACPVRHGMSEQADRMVATKNRFLELENDSIRAMATGDLRGELRRYHVKPDAPAAISVWEALLVDERFVYRTELEAPVGADQVVAVLEELARTIEPIAPRRVDEDPALLGMWGE